MLRGVVKTTVAKAVGLAAAPFWGNRLAGKSKPLLVVGYHKVVDEFQPDWKHGITSSQISRRMLEQHLDWIGRHYEFISLDELGEHLETGEPFSYPAAAVTFDDGYRDVYDHAFPLLRRKGIPAGVFVVTSAVGAPTPLLHDRIHFLVSRIYNTSQAPSATLAAALKEVLALSSTLDTRLRQASTAFAAVRALLELLRQKELHLVVKHLESSNPLDDSLLEKAQILTWDMAAAMSRAGITIGSHTRSHILLTVEDPRTVGDELSASRETLERHLDQSARHFAYPDGKFDTDAARAVSKAGFRFAYTICTHRLMEFPALTIPRKLLWERSCADSGGDFSPAIMNCQAKGFFDWFARCDQRHGKRSVETQAAAAIDPGENTVSTNGRFDK